MASEPRNIFTAFITFLFGFLPDLFVFGFFKM